MSVTIYYTESDKSEDVMSRITDINQDPDWAWEFIPVDEKFGIGDDEYLVHLDDNKVLVTPYADPPWPAKPSDAPKRASLSGWIHMNTIRNKDIGNHVVSAVAKAEAWYG